MNAAEWENMTKLRSWRGFQMDIIQHRRAQPVHVRQAIAHIITHEGGGSFTAKQKRVRDYWARVGEIAVKWYDTALGMNILAVSSTDFSDDPACHYRLLRFVVVSVAALCPPPS